VHFEPMPRVDCDPIVPPYPEFWDPAILGFELESRDLFERVLLRVPFDAEIVDRLVLEVFEELSTEGIGDFVLHVEVPAELGEDVHRCIEGDDLVLEILLLFAEWEDTELCYVVSEAVGGLRVFRHGDHYRGILLAGSAAFLFVIKRKKKTEKDAYTADEEADYPS